MWQFFRGIRGALPHRDCALNLLLGSLAPVSHTKPQNLDGTRGHRAWPGRNGPRPGLVWPAFS